MSHTSRLKRVPDAFWQLTGISPEAFDRLLAELGPRYQQADTTRKLLGFLFGVDQSSVCRNINPLQPLLAGIFRIPGRRVELKPDEIRELFFDATERAIPRPSRRQRRFYSGKKRRHTLKHQVVVVRKRKAPGRGGQRRWVRIAAVSKAFPGKAHDKKVYDRAAVACPPGVHRTGDTAYLGTGLCTPRRRPPKGRLTHRQKAGNRRLSRRRILVEHGIGKMKVWRIAAERYRNPRRRHTLIIKHVAGLHNLMYA